MALRTRCGQWTAALAALAVTASCGSTDRAVPRQDAPVERLDLGVVALTAKVGGEPVQSAGVVLDDGRGLILTTAHSVWGARSLKVATGIAVLHGRIVARDACDDLAVIETQPRLPGLVAVRPAAGAGGPVVAVRRQAGMPNPEGPELRTERVVVGSTPARTLLPGLENPTAVALDAPALPPAATGAPLIGADGRLAGIAQVVDRGRRTVRAALPWTTIDERMKELRPGGRAQYVGWRRHYRCGEALHRHTAARHAGYRRGDARLNAPVPATRLKGTGDVDG
jgi:S1-C subfamily serine protease